jgi:hypothetical protein
VDNPQPSPIHSPLAQPYHMDGHMAYMGIHIEVTANITTLSLISDPFALHILVSSSPQVQDQVQATTPPLLLSRINLLIPQSQLAAQQERWPSS